MIPDFRDGGVGRTEEGGRGALAFALDDD
jgi:hypothetical protein